MRGLGPMAPPASLFRGCGSNPSSAARTRLTVTRRSQPSKTRDAAAIPGHQCVLTFMKISPSFWEIIHESSGEPSRLASVLAQRSDEDLKQFILDFCNCHESLNRWEVWGAGWVMGGGMGDDSFHYFRSWIIGKGSAAYETAMTKPDDLGEFASENDEFDNELLKYVALNILDARGLDDPRDGLPSADGDPSGEEWDEDGVEALYPKLAKRFG